jgi:hypothetical protein
MLATMLQTMKRRESSTLGKTTSVSRVLKLDNADTIPAKHGGLSPAGTISAGKCPDQVL